MLSLIAVVLVTIFFRFWQIRDYMVFLGDEGRDMIVIRDIFVKHHIPFLGPTASVGGFYLGPIYYWMAAPFLFLWRFDPVGPSYMVATVGFLTVLLLYKFLKETAGFWPAIMASLLYATAPLIVRYSRSSWNPNPLPFFSLLLVYATYQAIKRNKSLWFLLAGASFGIAIQLHYLALLLSLVFLGIICASLNWKRWFTAVGLYALGALVTFSPFLIFEAAHNFPNFRTISEFVARGTNIGYKNFNFLWLLTSSGNIFLENISHLYGTIYTRIIVWSLLLLCVVGLYNSWKEKGKRIEWIIGTVWFFGGLLFLRLYTGTLNDYYFGFLFPAPFFLLGLVFSLLWQNKFLRVLPLTLTVLALIWFANNAFYKGEPNRLINQTEDIAGQIIQRTDGKPYNFALISDHNSDHAYRYFLDIRGKPPTGLETLVTDQLIVLCESKTCSPLGNPSWEVAGFGRGEVVGEWDLPKYGFKLFRLTHWPGVPSPAGKPAVKGG
ncbi:MAG: Glycosyl transferase family 39 [Candidatus Curtissbacteria bacterium GW2011_GWA1_40_16]|uniref:Glycosyl transferase family 39 n=1 Tax=Candidatus Curtissbacteria bacterium GW2011_GWA1_40_16 TaxID=1618405 RepID=A0A0G0RNB8_9BACT|nr:MAG: Glycosyl transferase family 39 [Candidatus Curtissbacteria bacterium GW2011_GWA1_40_16]